MFKVVVAFVSVLLAFLPAAPAWACKPAQGPDFYNDAANVARADAIALVHVTGVENAMQNGVQTALDRVTYRVVESLKGDAAALGAVSASHDGCHIYIRPDAEYVLFIDRDGADGQPSVMPHYAGSRSHLVGNAESARYLTTIEQLLSPSSPSASHP